MALRWGIISAGEITTDFVNGLHALSEIDHQLVAIADQDKERAEECAKKFSIPAVYGSYEELAKDPNVDVAYVGNYKLSYVGNNEHYDASILMLENGKHVLCEKPMCLNEKQLKKLVDFAKQKKLFLMEGIWSRCFPSYQYLKKQIDNGALGEIKSVEAVFGYPMVGTDRVA